MIGFHRFLEAIVKNSQENASPTRPKQTNGVCASNSPQSPRSARRPSTSAPARRLSLVGQVGSPQKPQSPRLAQHLVHGLEEGSIAKPPSSVAGACKCSETRSISLDLFLQTGARSLPPVPKAATLKLQLVQVKKPHQSHRLDRLRGKSSPLALSLLCDRLNQNRLQHPQLSTDGITENQCLFLLAVSRHRS
jgi:hypothetical protein